jgi:para-aminobenzoate synthetase/4-amino-4-deoxychorismate lyase
VTYEAAAAFGLCVDPAVRELPLAWFAICDSGPVRFEGLTDWSRSGARVLDPSLLRPSISSEQFARAFSQLQELIAAGETYQANYTFRLEGEFRGDARSFFVDLVAAQQGRYAAFIRLGDVVICSASPELFFRRTGRRIEVRPMKGTARRGLTTAEDRIQRDRLRASPKERAENVMILDMMRNDVGRLAAVGTVKVPEMLAVEKYPTVWQMTSSVVAETDAGLEETFAALHPSASVTGAPKVRTMEILSALEQGPRGVYTGAIGLVLPNGDAQFNVAIRTAVIDERRQTISFGIGSGIVWDSQQAGEYEECLLKAAVLGRRVPTFDLLETIRWTPSEGFFLLARHLNRLKASAEYFDYPVDGPRVLQMLDAAVAAKTEGQRVRLRVRPDGTPTIETTPLSVDHRVLQVKLAVRPIRRDDVFLYHKTTNRAVYEAAKMPGADDVVLWNERGEVTESTIANVVVERDGIRVTPPVQCGLLAGTFRADLLERGEIHEAVITREEVVAAGRVWLINSVQGWRPAAVDVQP